MPHVPSLHRAEPPRAVALPPDGVAAREERAAWRREREREEHFSLLRGLVWIALAVLVVSIARAGLGRAFVPGWWRQW